MSFRSTNGVLTLRNGLIIECNIFLFVHFFVPKKTNQKKALRKLYLHSVLVIFAVSYSSLFAPHIFLRFAYCYHCDWDCRGDPCGRPSFAFVAIADNGRGQALPLQPHIPRWRGCPAGTGVGKPHPVRDASLGRKKCTKKIAFHRNATFCDIGTDYKSASAENFKLSVSSIFLLSVRDCLSRKGHLLQTLTIQSRLIQSLLSKVFHDDFHHYLSLCLRVSI